MSGSNTATLTVAAPPTTEEVAVQEMTWIAGQSGVLTDYNQGSQIRTSSESIGSVVEMESVIVQAEAFQAVVYAAWGAFNVFPLPAFSAVGTVTFLTGTGANPPQVPVPILIPAGTVVQTVGGIQFQTLTNVTIPQNGTNVSAVASAVVPGSTGNVAAGAISQIASALAYPLLVQNAAPATGGTDAETPAQTMARFTAVVGSLRTGTPVSIANACIGVAVSGTTEIVKFATVFEPWIQQANEGQTDLTAGYQVYVDNGSGAASANLLAAVVDRLNGNLDLGLDGYRPAGVPYSVYAVDPIYCSVVVSGEALSPGLVPTLNASSASAVNSYFGTLQFGEAADTAQLTAAVANTVAGNISTLSVILQNASGVSVTQIIPPGIGRVILQQLVTDFDA